MLDVPSEQFQLHKIEIETNVTNTPKTDLRYVLNSDDDAYSYAKEILEIFNDGFQWADLASIIKISYEYVQKNQTLSGKQKKAKIVSILMNIVDLTDTPYLPDGYTDPLFKAMIPPFVDIVTKSYNGEFKLISPLESSVPKADTFKEYIAKITETFSDGFQWTDLAVCVRNTIEFVSGYSFLTWEAKKETVIEIINCIIDSTDTPYLPDTYVDPIFKSIIGPIVNLIFENLWGKQISPR